tara:strand:- start:3043 stop:3573 length:531 start_codon:yes stop_codon:yes gene_type:complete
MSKRQELANIYDEFRDLELNKEYYSDKVTKSKKLLRALDIFLALFASSSAVLSFSFWSSDMFGVAIGPFLLSLATIVAIILGIIRPYLKLEDNHERLSSIQGAYAAIAYVMADVVRKLKTAEEVTDRERAVYEALRQVRASLQSQEDKKTDKDLITRIQGQVNKRYPETYFYYPED